MLATAAVAWGAAGVVGGGVGDEDVAVLVRLVEQPPSVWVAQAVAAIAAP